MNENNIRKEIENKWYESKGFNRKHILNSSLFYSKERNYEAYRIAKSKLVNIFEKLKINSECKILLAPCGVGDDIKYIRNVTNNNISGIDIADNAIQIILTNKCIEDAIVGDIASMNYKNNKFDCVLSILFFHHVLNEGVSKYIFELKRVLKPGGALVILEPSSFYPIHWISRIVLKIVGNITGYVEGERPLNPLKLQKALIDARFSKVEVFAASFSHHRFPIKVAKIFEKFINPLLCKMPLIKYFGWTVYLIAQK